MAGTARPLENRRAAKEAAAERTETKVTGTSGPAKDDPATLTEDELLFGPIYGAGGMAKAATHGEPTGRVSPERLKALAKEEPSKAEKFRVSGVLHLPGDRVLDLGSVSVEPGRAMKFERIRESPFPTSIKMAEIDPKNGGSFPVSPTTPGSFETRDTGIVIEVDVTPAAGTLVLGGQVMHRTLDGFGRMPGEVFSPIWTTGVSETGASQDVILTENKVMQPQFSVSEVPFLAAAAAGEPCRVPVRMGFGQTILELTCVPVE